MTVAVLPTVPMQDWGFSVQEIEWTAVRGSGSGGQAKNKTSNSVHMKHLPSGITVRVESSRSQWANRQAALGLLAARYKAQLDGQRNEQLAADRRDQVGSGQRGDKIRTIRMQDQRVIDHRTGKRMNTTRYLQGHINELF